MKKQKVCIVGGGLTGLITAIALSKLNLQVDLAIGSTKPNIKSNKTTAISQENYDFIKSLEIINFFKMNFWSCSQMKLYTENKFNKFDEIFKIEKEKNPKEKILYMMKNSQIINSLLNSIKKEKLVNIKSTKKVSNIVSQGLLKSLQFKNIDPSKYNLVLICTGNDLNLFKSSVLEKEMMQYSYNEVAVTAILKHNSFKNQIARQIFLDNEIFAFLPISNDKTSIVWSVKKELFKNKTGLNEKFFKKKINKYANLFLKKSKIISAIESRDLNFMIRNKYYNDRVLLFGDSLHLIHPLAGQGFNMILRDLITLKKILKKKLDLGLDIGASDILDEFSSEIRGRNFAYSVGIDFLKRSFSINDKSFKFIRNLMIKNLDNNNAAKDFAYNLANKGIGF